MARFLFLGLFLALLTLALGCGDEGEIVEIATTPEPPEATQPQEEPPRIVEVIGIFSLPAVNNQWQVVSLLYEKDTKRIGALISLEESRRGGIETVRFFFHRPVEDIFTFPNIGWERENNEKIWSTLARPGWLDGFIYRFEIEIRENDLIFSYSMVEDFGD